MTLSQFLYFPAVLLLGAGLTARPLPAQTAAAAQTSSPAASNNTVVEDIVARVNDQIITQSDYERSLQQLESEGRQQGIPPQDMEERKANLLRDLIDQQLLLSKGKDLGITGEAELIRRLDDIRKQNHLDTMEDLEKAAASQGVSYEDFKANIRNGIITQQVVRDEVGRHLNMTQSEVQAYYKAHQSEFAQPESVHLREILIATPADASAAQVSAAQATADSLEAKLKAGANFEDLAKTSSAGSTADRGGDLGDFRRGMLAPVLEEKTFSLKAGEFTEPIRTKQGFVILQVAQHIPSSASFKDVEPQVEQAVFMEHMQPALRQYLTKLREAAYLEIKPGYVDSGASPNEIHPTYTAYEPPQPKKKKKFARTRFRGKDRSAAKNTQVASSAAKQPAAAPAAPVQKPVQVASKNDQKPGKREKIRFGQAPRESLPSAQSGSALAAKEAPAQTTAAMVNPDIHTVNPDGTIGAETETQTKQRKTRFSDRPAVKKTKVQKPAAADETAGGPTPDELATQKVQSAPLGLADQTAKKKTKEKGPKTRYSARPKAPEQTPQPYQPQSSTTSEPPPASQPASGTPANSVPQ
ncbi:MAG TPA: peptidylprolyl isomerase [Acidobacteriaceae bacterium]|nr:peptidylprolyl isomerase [Acidobacteriaceae bacterium]